MIIQDKIIIVMANSKKKGNRFELKVSKWFTEFSGYKFQRVPYSGANHINRDLASDIMCSDEKHAHRCKISIECKSYQDIRFEHVLLGNKRCKIIQFWNQAASDANRAKKIPILCMRYNSMPRDEFFFIVDSKLSKVLISNQLDHLLTLKGKDIPNLYVFMASEVIKKVNYKDIHKEAKLQCKTLYK